MRGQGPFPPMRPGHMLFKLLLCNALSHRPDAKPKIFQRADVGGAPRTVAFRHRGVGGTQSGSADSVVGTLRGCGKLLALNH